MKTRLAAVLTIVVIASATSAKAQPARRQSPSVLDPVELSGPPKKPPITTPAMRAFADSGVLKADIKDPKVLAGVIRELTMLIERFPDEADLYFFRATMSCQNNGARESTLNDVMTAMKLRPTRASIVSDSERDELTLKSKVEFDLGRYEDAMTDVDSAIRAEYDNADHVFNDGNAKPNESASSPCAWAMNDLNKLAQLFPNDYRPPLYLGLYLLHYSHYSLDFDFEPMFKAFDRG
jgi:hypothetical protein